MSRNVIKHAASYFLGAGAGIFATALAFLVIPMNEIWVPAGVVALFGLILMAGAVYHEKRVKQPDAVGPEEVS